jgi:hypothetical protein
MKDNKISNILAQLTCAALALPGLMQTASAGRVEETYNADFQYGHYSENQKRMQVDIFEGALSAPIGKSMTASVNLVRDNIAGASPVYNTRDQNGKITQTLSGASPQSSCGKSICEQRDAISGNLAYFLDKGALGFGGGYSREHDYASKFFNTTASLDLNKKLTTLNFGASVAFDEIEPSPSGYTTPPFDSTSHFKGHKTSQQYLLGVSQVLDKDSVIKSNVSFGYHDGYLTDPYKQVAFYGNVNYVDLGFVASGQETFISEKRPRQRFEWAWLNQYVRHFEQLNHAALHTDYRFSTNDWGVNAHTVELSWHQPIIQGWQIIPSFRYYSQDQADFYKPVFNGDIVAKITDFTTFTIRNSPSNRRFYSSDYRLAGFGTISGGIQLSKEINVIKPFSQLKFQTGIEYYSHKSDYQLGGSGHGAFADFNYYLVTASFNLRF